MVSAQLGGSNGTRRPICARGPGRGPVSWCGLGSVLSWLPLETEGRGWGALCRCMCNHSSRLHCEGGSPRATLSNASLCTWETEIPPGAEGR